MADAEILFDNLSYLGDLLVSFDFKIREFCRCRVLSHDAVFDIVFGQKTTIGLPRVAFIGIYFLDGCFCMFTENGTVIQIIGVIDRSRIQGGRQDEAVVGVHGGMFLQAIVGDIVFDGLV